MRKPIALVGLPGAGKSTLGKLLSKKLNTTFIDTDAVIESKIGTSIREYFALHGEDVFRAIEADVLAQLVANPVASILATGGGIVLRDANRLVLKKHTTAVYLRSTATDLYARLKHDTVRPLLQVDDPHARLQELFVQRDPLYREVATFTVDTARTTVSALVNKIVMQLELAPQC
nr:shikimate kinase [Curvibacter sp. CHRR-16]